MLIFLKLEHIHPKRKIADAAVGGKIGKLVKQGYILAARDLICTGKAEDNANLAMLIFRSSVGIQTGDKM